MLATFAPATQRFTATNAPHRRAVRFTWDEVLELTRLGMLPEDATTELLDGQIVLVDRSERGGNPDMPGPAHVDCTENFVDLRGRINSSARHARAQQPLRCSPNYVPLPDFMILRGERRVYAGRTPNAADAFCVIEIADSSLDTDLGDKLAAYARAGVPQYVVIDLRRRVALVHEGPDPAAGTYPPPVVLAAEATLCLRAGDGGETLDVPLADVLP